jgi:hypothetical protein
MIRIILIASIALLLAGCGDGSSEPELSKDIKYTISEDAHTRGIKRSVVVILEEKVIKEDLQKLASRIKNSDPSSYQRTFIGYYLKGKDRNNGYWATTHFNPELEVRVLGLSKEEEASLAKPVVSSPDRKVLGVWLDDRPGVGAKMTIYYSKEGNLYLESSYSDGSSGTKEMIDFAIDNGKRIEDKEGSDFGEYFVVNRANQLEFWSKNGNYYTAKSIQ